MIDLAYIIVTSASGVFKGRPLRNARDITILDAFASLIVPWKIPKSSIHFIETAFPTQFSLIFLQSYLIQLHKYNLQFTRFERVQIFQNALFFCFTPNCESDTKLFYIKLFKYFSW